MEREPLNYYPMPLNGAYKEILRLHDILSDMHIPHELRRLFDGWQIIYPSYDNWVCDAIEHIFSYGHEADCVKLAGLLNETEAEYDSVSGYLKAEDVAQRIAFHWNRRFA